MNILLWYLPFAMFTETCDLMISECKAPPHGRVDQSNRSVGRIHGADDVDVLRQSEGFVVSRVQQLDSLVSVFK